MIDEPNNFRYFSKNKEKERNMTVPTWSGQVDHISPRTGKAIVGNNSDSANVTDVNHPFELFHQQAAMLAYSSHSRYQAPPTGSNYSRLDEPLPRHVNWDDMDDDDDDENEEEREFRARRERQQWLHNTELPLQEKLTSFWEPSPEEPHVLPSSSSPPLPPQEQHHDVAWRMFWMPPYPCDFAVPLPISSWTGARNEVARSSDSVVETWDNYVNGSTGSSWDQWKEDELRERLRHVLEDCDSLQGVTMITQGHGVYAGLATELLQELQDECRTAGKLAIHVADDTTISNSLQQSNSDSVIDKENNPPSLSSSSSSIASWQVGQASRVRNMLQRALTMHGLATNANVVLPVTLLNHGSSLFAESAKLALALETATLPYRLGPSSGSCSSNSLYPSKIGLNSYYTGNLTGEFPFGTAACLSFGEYLACLQPSQQYRLIELDACTSPIDKFTNVLQAGTSLERDSRMRESDKSAGAVGPPGAWMQTDATKGGIMSSFSPSHESATTDRSMHHHFALAASLRPADEVTSLTTPSQQMSLPLVSQYVKSLMEGMGVRYRPEVSVASVLEQSVGKLTSGGYGAGSYWHTTCWNHNTQQPPPVLSVLSNTSRVYPRLYSITSDAKQVLTSIRFRGFYNRDVQNGVLPEREDSEDALSYCLDLRDLYHPPEGSGLGMDAE
jgi:hypothetical protein